MVEKEVTIKNRAGIHARPAAMIVQTASRYEANVFIEKDSEKINAKSIMGIITLGAAYKTTLKVVCEGPDEQDALDGMVHIFENRFEEE